MSCEGEYDLKRLGVNYLHLLIFLNKPAIYNRIKGQPKILCIYGVIQFKHGSFATNGTGKQHNRLEQSVKTRKICGASYPMEWFNGHESGFGGQFIQRHRINENDFPMVVGRIL
jgi:hypothetical protein